MLPVQALSAMVDALVEVVIPSGELGTSGRTLEFSIQIRGDSGAVAEAFSSAGSWTLTLPGTEQGADWQL